MWRRAAYLLSSRSFSSEQEIPGLYSFLQPSIFSLKRTPQRQATLSKSQENSLSQPQRSNLETNLQKFLFDRNTDEAWKAFKTFTNSASFPSDLQSASATILRYLKEGEEQCFSEGTCHEIVEGFLRNGNLKGLANLVMESQKLEPASFEVDKSVGYGVITACINLGLLDKACSILQEMNVQGASVGLGAYVPILKAYSREKRTVEAAQLVTEICNLGLPLDVVTYDSLIESSMSCQDFRSAFSLYRDMRESRVCELKGSYLTIMTGLTERHRPELMAAFMDEVVQDPRVEVGTHDWNSIIHAFCKAGRMEDARRTFRRMVFLHFEPNEQTYLSLINGYVAIEKYFSILLLWNEVKRKIFVEGEKRLKLDTSLVDAFLYALVRGGFFDAVMQVVEKSQEMKIFVDKWRYKQAFMEKHKKLRVSRLRHRNSRKMESLIAFKNWAGLSA